MTSIIAATLAASATSPTTTDKPAVLAVISDAAESAILGSFRTLHHQVLQAVQSVGQKALFNDKWEACVGEDYKALHQQARLLVKAKADHKWDTYAKGVTSKLSAVIDTYMGKARASKARIDALREATPEDERAFLPTFGSTVKIPFPALIPCFEGKETSDILVELNKLFPAQVGNSAPKGQKEVKITDIYLSVPFTMPKAEVVAAPTPAEEAPKSGEVDTAVAA